jgi:hypothetical protein
LVGTGKGHYGTYGGTIGSHWLCWRVTESTRSNVIIMTKKLRFPDTSHAIIQVMFLLTVHFLRPNLLTETNLTEAVVTQRAICFLPDQER